MGASGSGGGSSSFGSFGGAPAEPATATTFVAAGKASPHGVRSGGFSAAAAAGGSQRAETPTADEAPVPVPDAVTTGEEDEICVHRVRAKLFKLEVRFEPARPPSFPAAAGGADDDQVAPAAAAQGGEDAPAEAADADPAAEVPSANAAGAASSAAAAPAAAPAAASSSSTLNPHAAPFVPATANGGATATKADGKSKEADGDDDEEEDDDDDDDDEAAGGGDDAASATTKATEANEGPLVEVTRWAERGVGGLRLLVHKPLPPSDNGPLPYPRLVMRVENVGRLILNEHLLPTMAPAERVSDTSIRLVLLSAAAGPQSYLLRVKTANEAADLIARINSTIPAVPEGK